MSDKMLRIQAEELTTIRVRCQYKDCLGIIEMPVDRARAKFSSINKCPLCATEFTPSNDEARPIHDLAAAICNLKDCAKRVKVEFLIPESK